MPAVALLVDLSTRHFDHEGLFRSPLLVIAAVTGLLTLGLVLSRAAYPHLSRIVREMRGYFTTNPVRSNPLPYVIYAAAGGLLAAAVAVLAFLGSLISSGRSHKEWVGRLAPDFRLETLRGESLALSDRVGKEVLVVNFFATRCGPCRQEIPELHATYPVAIDPGEVGRLHGVQGFPTTVVIGADGRIRDYRAGAMADVGATLGESVEISRHRPGAPVLNFLDTFVWPELTPERVYLQTFWQTLNLFTLDGARVMQLIAPSLENQLLFVPARSAVLRFPGRSESYLVFSTRLYSHPRTALHVFDVNGTLVYQELLENQHGGLAVIPDASGRTRALLVGGRDDILQYEPVSPPEAP